MYRGEDEFTDGVGAFLRAATAADEPVLLALPGEHLDQFRGMAGQADRLAYEDMREVGRNPNHLLPFIEGWVAAQETPTDPPDGAERRLRIVSETVWPGRSYPERAECLRHEALVNAALADAPVTLLCPYDAAQLDAETVAGVELTHPAILEDGRRRPSLAYRGLAELDLDEIWPLEPPAAPVHEHDLGGSLQELRQAVAADPLVGGLSPDRRSDLVLAVNEATTNAVRYGEGACSARIWHDGRCLVTEIVSDSAVRDPLTARRPRPEPEADRGRGLWLINQVCDLVEMRSGNEGMRLRLHMRDEPAL